MGEQVKCFECVSLSHTKRWEEIFECYDSGTVLMRKNVLFSTDRLPNIDRYAPCIQHGLSKPITHWDSFRQGCSGYFSPIEDSESREPSP